MAVIGILAALSAREYSKYMEKAYLSSYALPLARSCFMELSEYCASNPNASGVTPATLGPNSVCSRLFNQTISSATLGTNSTCDRLNSTDGISTAKGTVKMESGFPNSCNQYGTPNYSRDIVVTLSSASRYRLVCMPRLVEAIGSGQNQTIIKIPECVVEST